MDKRRKRSLEEVYQKSDTLTHSIFLQQGNPVPTTRKMIEKGLGVSTKYAQEILRVCKKFKILKEIKKKGAEKQYLLVKKEHTKQALLNFDKMKNRRLLQVIKEQGRNESTLKKAKEYGKENFQEHFKPLK